MWELAAAGLALGVAGGMGQQDWNRKYWHEQRDWQTEMSNTQYQRAMSDMAAAGLNPMLAAKLGGAGVPSAPGIAPAPNVGLAGVESANSAVATQQKSAEAQQIAAQTNKTKAETDLISTQAANIQADTVLKTNSAAEAETRIGKLMEEIEALRNRRPVSKLEGFKADDEYSAIKQASSVETNIRGDGTVSRKYDRPADWVIEKLRNEVDASRHVKDRLEIESRIALLEEQAKGLGIPEKRAYANMFKSPAGKYIPWVREGSDVLSSAGRVADLIRQWRGR